MIITLIQEKRYENIGSGISVCVNGDHKFGTDSFLLSYFAAPRRIDAVCDLCAGCGIISLLWFRGENRPEKAYAVDIQPEAVALMRLTLEKSGGIEGFVPVLSDLRDLRGKLPAGRFDLVTCNPPYKAADSGILSASESDRIARHETMCTIEDACESASRLLRFGGRFCVCQMPERLVDVLAAMRLHKIEPKKLRLVQNTAGSAPWLILVEGKLGSKPFMRIEPPLLLKENGVTSEEMKKIYGMYGYMD